MNQSEVQREARKRYAIRNMPKAANKPLTPMFLEREVLRLELTRVRATLERLGLWGKV